MQPLDNDDSHTRSFLVPINGSQHSRFAFELATRLAERCNAKLTVEHVVDTDAAWELFGHDIPGIIGSAPWIAAYESLRGSLMYLGNSLVKECRALLQQAIVEHEVLLDEGNPAEEICMLARYHDIVIIGHRRITETHTDEANSQIRRTSVAESLARKCAAPLLIVQDESAPWKKVKIFATMTSLDRRYVEGALSFAEALSAQPEIVLLGNGSAPAPETLAERHPAISNVAISSCPLDMEILEIQFSRALVNNDESVTRPDDETLIVMPTHFDNGKMQVLLGQPADEFVHSSLLPAVVLWPQDSLGKGTRKPDGAHEILSNSI